MVRFDFCTFVFWGWYIISFDFIDNPDPKLRHHTHTDPYKHLSALTCGDRAVGGWVRSVEWAADRKPCALLTDWCVSGADSTSCWRNRQRKKKKKQSNWGESQPKWNKANLKQPPSWAKKRLKIMRRESGCCVLSTIPVTSLGNCLFFRPSSNRVCGRSCASAKQQNYRVKHPLGSVWGSVCCDCQSGPSCSQDSWLTFNTGGTGVPNSGTQP